MGIYHRPQPDLMTQLLYLEPIPNSPFGHSAIRVE
jgi:hypothetical protein